MRRHNDNLEEEEDSIVMTQGGWHAPREYYEDEKEGRETTERERRKWCITGSVIIIISISISTSACFIDHGPAYLIVVRFR